MAERLEPPASFDNRAIEKSLKCARVVMKRTLAVTILVAIATEAAHAGKLTELIDKLRIGNPDALREVAKLGEAAAPTAKTVVKLLDRPDLRELAETALIAIGPKAFPDVMRGLKAKTTGGRIAAGNVLASYAAKQPEVVDRYLKRLLTAHRSAVGTARYQIELQFPWAGKKSLPVLRAECEHTHPARRATAALALGRNRFAQDEDAKRLIAICGDADPRVRRNAFDSLGRLKRLPDDTLAALWKGVNDPDSAVRTAAQGGILTMDKHAVPSVLASLGKGVFTTRAAGWFLRPDAKALMKIADSDDIVRSAEALRVLGYVARCGRVPSEGIRLLVAAREAGDARIRAAGAEAFVPSVELKEEGRVERLIDLLGDPDASVRLGAANGLAVIGESMNAARVDTVRIVTGAILKEKHSPAFQTALAKAYSTHGGDPDRAIDAHRRSLAREASVDAARELWEYGARAIAGVPELTGALSGPPEVQIQAMHALENTLGRRRRVIHLRRRDWQKGPDRARIEAGLDWLAKHQDTRASKKNGGTGRWSAARFGVHDGAKAGDDAGLAEYDIGITGLALMAFLAAGYTDIGDDSTNPYARNVREGFEFLQRVQSTPGATKIPDPVIQQAILLTAAAEIDLMAAHARYAMVKVVARSFLLEARNPGSGWRYGRRPGNNDSFCTAWAASALALSKLAGDRFVQDEALLGARAWFHKVTDWDFVQMGYMRPGYVGAELDLARKRSTPRDSKHWTVKRNGFTEFRSEGKHVKFPWTYGSHAAASWALDWTGGIPKRRGAIAILAEAHEEVAQTTALCSWFFGTAVLSIQAENNKYAKIWLDAVRSAVIKSQELGKQNHGSWAPIGKWGPIGGRVYSTSMSLLTLLAPGRYDRNNLELRRLTDTEQKALKKLKSLRRHKDLGVREAAIDAVEYIESAE